MDRLKTAAGSIWVWWIFLTVIYGVFNFFGYPLDQSEMKYIPTSSLDLTSGVIRDGDFREVTFLEYATLYPVESILTVTASTIGVFVPYGAASLLLFIATILSWISVLVFFFLMYVVHKRLVKSDISIFRKIVIILVSLMVITTVVDFVRGTPFVSWNIFINAGAPHYCC